MTGKAKRASAPSIVVWDLPMRLFHWGVALILPAMWWTAKNDHMSWHILLGTILLALLIFRLLWGLVGSSTARFKNFVAGPEAIKAYVRRHRHGEDLAIGHNPLGALSVLAMLSLLGLQVGLGLVAGDPDDGAIGPLHHLVRYTTALAATEWHEILFNAILALVVLHVTAICYYCFVRRAHLVGPMIHGRKTLPGIASQPPLATPFRATACALLAGLVAWWISSGAPLGPT